MSVSKTLEKTKIPKFVNPNALLSIFDQECLIWVFQVKNIKKKPFLYFKSAPSNLSNCKILPKEKALGLGQKLPYLGIFGQEI